MKLLILGANGQLGSDLCRVAKAQGHGVVPIQGRQELDVTQREAVRERISAEKPEVIINTAARCDVDACETDSARAFEVNAAGARNVAEACKAKGARLIHFSTDYVFSGEKGTPYLESDAPGPVNVYGASKLAGEQFVRAGCENSLIVRTSGLFGTKGSREKGGNFVETMVRLSAQRSELRLVSDQFLSPTYTLDLAEAVLGLAGRDLRGVVHVCNQGVCSWLEWAQEVFRLLNRQVRVIPVSLKEFGPKAKRPLSTALASEVLPKAGIAPLPPWQDAVRRYLREAGYEVGDVRHE